MSSDQHSAGVTQDELDLSRPEAFDRFLESAEDVYVDAARYRNLAQAEAYSSLQFDDVKGEEIFTTLYVILRELQILIVREKEQFQAGETAVSEQSVLRMQKLYDNMLLLRGVVVSAYQDRILVSSPQTSQSFTEIANMILDAKKRLDVIKARVLAQLSAVEQSEQALSMSVKLSELVSTLENLNDRVVISRREVTDAAVIAETQQVYQRTVQDILAEAMSIERSLQQSRDVKTVATQLSMKNNTSRVRPVADTCGTGLIKTKDTDSHSQELPSEAMVANLVKPVLENWLYTDTERAKVLQLCEAFHRSVAMAEPFAVSKEKFQALNDRIRQIKTKPEIEELRERINRIVKRVTAGAISTSHLLQNTRTLVQTFHAVDADKQSSYEQRISVYTDLYTYVFDHEKEWLTVCGMSVPLPGPEGVVMARALRETLLVERDRHNELIRDPKKQMTVDKLIRKLSDVPPNGLRAEIDIPEIVALMRAIDVQGQQGQLVKPVSESRTVTQFDQSDETVMIKGLGSQDPVHKTMSINADDIEIPIMIDVASRAREQIIQQTSPSKPTPVLPISEVKKAAKQDGAVIAHVETSDPINTVVPNVASHRITRVKPVHEARSLTKVYLSQPAYQEFITTHYSSLAAFERLLDTTITQIEAKTVDVFERWLQEEKKSPFAYLEEMTVGEVLRLGSDRQVRVLLFEKNIKYETFLTWLDLIPEMQSVVGSDERLKFGALFARWVIESEMFYASSVAQ